MTLRTVLGWVGLGSLVVGLLLGPGTTKAFEFLESDEKGNIRLETGQDVDDTLFGAGSDVDLRAGVTGDAYLAGRTVSVSGPVGGDLIAAASEVSITGRVAGDVIAFAGIVKLAADAEIGGDLLLMSGDAEVLGPVRGEVRAYSGSVDLGGEIGQDAEVNAATLKLLDGAKVHGALRGQVESAPTTEALAAAVDGEVTLNEPGQDGPGDVVGRGAGLVGWILGLTAALIVGLVAYLLAPKAVQSVRETAQSKPWLSLLVGLLTLVASPILFILLLAFVVTIPVAILELVLFIGAIILGGIFGRLLVGDWLGKSKWPLLQSFVVGAVVVALIVKVPLIGGLAGFLLWLVGLGAVILGTWQLLVKLGR